jgi:hypothetical protein
MFHPDNINWHYEMTKKYGRVFKMYWALGVRHLHPANLLAEKRHQLFCVARTTVHLRSARTAPYPHYRALLVRALACTPPVSYHSLLPHPPRFRSCRNTFGIVTDGMTGPERICYCSVTQYFPPRVCTVQSYGEMQDVTCTYLQGNIMRSNARC